MSSLMKKHGSALISLFIIATMVFSSIAYVVSMRPISISDEKVTYDSEGNKILKYGEYNIDVTYLPTQLEGMLREDRIDYRGLKEFAIGYSLDEQNVSQEYGYVIALKKLQAKLVLTDKLASIGCVNNCSFTKIDCDNTTSAIIFKESIENNIFKENNCYILETSDIDKFSDYILYKITETIE